MRLNQILLVCCDGVLRANRFDWGKSADLNLLLGIRQSFLRESERLLLNSDVLEGINEVPVEVFNLIRGGDDLQTKGYIGYFTVVFCDSYEPVIGQKPETLQQLLRHLEFEP